METDNAKQAGFFGTIKAAFPHTIPVLTGYVFLGIAFGMLLQSKGYGPVWAGAMGIFIYAGSMQIVSVGILAAGFDPVSAFVMTLMVNARHLFYGISMLEQYKDYKGLARFYMIFSLTDETFALLCSAKPPQGIKPQRFYLAISAMDQCYWVLGCITGGILGTALPINTEGIDFVMTALFVVILLEQWKKRQNRLPALIGFAASIASRLLFGTQWFIIACMLLLVLAFTVWRQPIERTLPPIKGEGEP